MGHERKDLVKKILRNKLERRRMGRSRLRRAEDDEKDLWEINTMATESSGQRQMSI
jgi:chorismate synthase